MNPIPTCHGIECGTASVPPIILPPLVFGALKAWAGGAMPHRGFPAKTTVDNYDYL